MYLARDVMTTDVFKLRADATVGVAMTELVGRGISGAPVVEGRDELVGIISEYQLLEAIYVPQFQSCRIRDVMSSDVITVTAESLLSDVANLMMMHRIRRIPVVRNREVIGLIARRDLLRYVISAGETLETFLNELTAPA
ncbi:MAG: CBS domain-containing protein [Candidatus Nealsonbacteria bacterium]|nr:CBS domain-containing protein [Candidatus Nealsonbacteria bacterium]